MVQLKSSPHHLEWIKFGKIKNVSFVGKDFICFGMNQTIIFVNINTNEEVLYKATGGDVGEGVHYVTGNKSFPNFAFAECSVNPRIFVKTFPEFTNLCTLYNGTDAMYTCLKFSEFDYLVSLDGIPNFQIIVWNWRNGEKISHVESNLLSENVIIRCSKTYPMLIAQMEVGGKQLKVWEVLLCGNQCMLLDHDVQETDLINPLSSVLWTTDGALLILDCKGNIYNMTADYKCEQVIAWQDQSNCDTCFCLFRGAIITSGPNGDIKLFRKSGAYIEETWNTNPPQAANDIIVSQKDSLIVLTNKRNIFKYDPNENMFLPIRPHQSNFNELCLVYPMGEEIVTLAQNNEVCLWDISTGELLDFIEFSEYALNMQSHKSLPFIGISFDNGLVVFLRVQYRKLVKVKEIHLTRNPLHRIHFAEMSKIIVTGDLNVGQFFVLEGIPGSKLQVIATVSSNMQFADFILIASKTCFRLFGIIVTSNEVRAGCKFMRFCIIKGRTKVDMKEYEIPRSRAGVIYDKLFACSSENRDRVFYAMPYARKELHELEVKRGERFAKINKKIHFNHYMKNIMVQMDDHHYVTYCYGGVVMIRSTDWTQQHALLTTHHRRYRGTMKAYTDPFRQFVVALGRDNTIVCVSLPNAKINSSKRYELLELMDELEDDVDDGYINPIFEGKVWLEIEEIKLRERERIICEKERKHLIADFKELREEVKRLLTKNLKGPDNEKLDIQEFNLDEDTKVKQIYDNDIDCNRTRTYLLNLIIAQDLVTEYIRKMCWDIIETQGKSLCAIFGNYCVDNYALLPLDGQELETQNFTEAIRNIELLLSCDDSFEPWVPQPKREISEALNNSPSIALQVPTPDLTLFLTANQAANEEEVEIGSSEERDMETISAFAGSMAHTFVTIEKMHYTQQQVYSFFQMYLQRVMTNKENYKLKVYFNKEFENMLSIKTREINNVQERNARLQHILSEFNYFSEEKLDIEVTNPTWLQIELPEKIVKVEDDEVGVTPYISPSEQLLLDEIAAEKERLRLLMLADDFKERALYAMMWGVLEIRWEDELRKDVPKPKCMLEKDPENYNEEDLRAIMDYEEKVKFLNSERERYKKILTSEYFKLGNNLREGVKKFNSRLCDLLLLKLKIEVAIAQENFRIVRLRSTNQKRIDALKCEDNELHNIKENDKVLDTVSKQISSLQQSQHDVKVRCDSMQSKEKALERSFKREFADANPVAMEQLNKFYKKRPKLSLKNVTSITVLLELARCIVEHDKSLILTHECLDYMKALDTLDMFIGVAILNEETYANMCRLRRIKIKNEILIKAYNMELVEADNTISVYNKILSNKKELHTQYSNNLVKIRADYIKEAQNQELQVVLKQGFVEVPTTGHIADFNEAILVSRNDVFDINQLIVKVGNKKLKAMRETMEFRRGILAMEWEHRRMRMRIYDLNQHLKDIYSVKLSKEMQAYLKMKAKGISKELTFEQEIELLKKSYERFIEEHREHVNELKEKIRSIKRETKKINGEISNINVDVCEYKLEVDEELEQREKDMIRMRMATLLKRAKLVKQIQENHNEILVLHTEMELLRLKTYPTLKFKVVL